MKIRKERRGATDILQDRIEPKRSRFIYTKDQGTFSCWRPVLQF
jgi:hypothetical protein